MSWYDSSKIYDVKMEGKKKAIHPKGRNTESLASCSVHVKPPELHGQFTLHSIYAAARRSDLNNASIYKSHFIWETKMGPKVTTFSTKE